MLGHVTSWKASEPSKRFVHFSVRACGIQRNVWKGPRVEQLRDRDAVLWEGVLRDSGRGSREGEDDVDDASGERCNVCERKATLLDGSVTLECGILNKNM